MSTYDQFTYGSALGDSFVRANEDGTYTRFYYDLSNGVITINEYTDSDTSFANQIRTIQYNTGNDGIMDYAYTSGYDYQTEKVSILGSGNDHVHLNGLNDYVDGYLGHDVIYAGDGNNRVFGGEGSDDLSASEGNDMIFGNAGDDGIAGGSGTDYLFGGDGMDFIEGNPGDDVLSGGLGDDILLGGNGNDILFDIHGNNHFHGQYGDDFIIAGDGQDYVYGDEGNDIIHGGGGADFLYGDGGNDHIFAGDGYDVVHGGGGMDVLYGGAQNDYIDGGAGDDILYGQSGSDELKGRGGNDILVADDPNSTAPYDNDKLRGGDGEDTLYAGSGRDTLYGDEGNDLLVASDHGQAVMHGGAGDDVFAFNGLPAGDAHRIEDFGQSGDHDVLNISDIISGFDPLSSNINDFVELVYRDAYRTDVKVSVEGTGHDWIPLALLSGDFGGVSAQDLHNSGQLVLDHRLFAGDA